MKNFFWSEGRLGWPFVAAIVFLTLSLMVVDLAWRLIELPVETLAVYAALAIVACAVAIIFAYRQIRTRR